MAAHSLRRVFRVFLASPSDVTREREIAEEVINDLNKIVAPRRGWQIELHKWEDTVPGFGRAQSLINPKVDECDLFIGLLWERWGQPTGKYSSGFREEYELALTRRKETGKPNIWLIFKAPRPEKLSDPGPELNQVMEFRRAQAPEVLYREVQGTEEWGRQIHNWMLEQVLDLPEIKEPPSESQSPAFTPSSQVGQAQTPDKPAEEEAEQKKEIPEQLVEVSRLLARLVETGQLEFSLKEEKLFTEFDTVRLFLASAAWMSTRYTADPLGTHEANLIYKHRHQLQILSSERFLLIRTLFSDRADVIPGWYWFVERSQKTFVGFLFFLTGDRSENVQRRALELLTAARVPLSNELWPRLPLADDSKLVRIEAYKYLGEVSDERALPIVEKYMSGNGQDLTASAARAARLTILSRLKPAQAYSELIQNPDFCPDRPIEVLRDTVRSIPTPMLAKGISNPKDKIRELAVQELARRGALSVKVAQRLTEDDSTTIKIVAFKELARKGCELDLDKLYKAIPSFYGALSGETGVVGTVLDEFFKTLSTEEIQKHIDWLSLDGPEAYRFIAIYRPDAVRLQIRSDIETGFQRIREQHIKATKAQLGELLAQKYEAGLEKAKLDDFVKSTYLQAALDGLAANGVPVDISIGRQHLSHSDDRVRFAAVKIIMQFGDASDAAALVQSAKSAWGELSKLAGEAALKLSPKPFEVARELVKTDKNELVRIGFRWLLAQHTEEVRHFFWKLLDDKDDQNRERAVYYLTRGLQPAELKELLEEYLRERDSYYYNVVTWLDRLIYALSPLKEMYVGQLQKSAQS